MHRREPQARRRRVLARGAAPAPPRAARSRCRRSTARRCRPGSGRDRPRPIRRRSIPGSVASRCIQPAPSAARDRGAVETLAADHDEPRRARLAGQPGPVEMLLRCGRRPPARPAGGRGRARRRKPLTRSTSCAPDRGARAGRGTRAEIGYRAALDDEAVEIVVVVLAFELVQRRAGRRDRPRRRRRGPSATAGGTLPCSRARPA